MSSNNEYYYESDNDESIYDDDDDDDQSSDMVMKTVLPVANFDDYDPNIPPQSGAEYLRRVQLEAQREPNIKVASNLNIILNSTLPYSLNNLMEDFDNDEFIPSKPKFSISQKTVSQVIDHFTITRQRLNELRDKSKEQFSHLRRSESWWKEFCLEKSKHSITTNEEDLSQTRHNLNSPRLSLMNQLSQNQIYLLLKYQSEWILEEYTPNNGLWIYSLLASLDTTQTGEVYSLLRVISRLCSRIRHKLVTNFEKQQFINDDKDSKSYSQKITSLILIIAIIGHFFGQKDLIDPYSVIHE